MVGVARLSPIKADTLLRPFPSNLMVGCFGVADDSQKIRLDLDNELEGWLLSQQLNKAHSQIVNGSPVQTFRLYFRRMQEQS